MVGWLDAWILNAWMLGSLDAWIVAWLDGRMDVCSDGWNIE
jgi:hypothetical protein